MIHPSRPVLAADVADHYDDLDVFYREVWGEHVHHGLWRTGRETPDEAVRALVRHLAMVLEVGEGTRVVDVGSGYGATARQLAREHGARVTAVTLSEAQHAAAVANGDADGRVTYLCGDWTTNTLPDAAYDRAVAIESTEHMVDRAAAFRQLQRVLGPGGRLAICAWIAADAPAPWMVNRLLEPICREGRLTGMGTEADYRQLLQENGFRVDVVEDLSRSVSATWRHSVQRVASRLASDGRYRRYLLDRTSRNREFALTLLRILAAYRVGAMRYLLFVATRREGEVR